MKFLNSLIYSIIQCCILVVRENSLIEKLLKVHNKCFPQTIFKNEVDTVLVIVHLADYNWDFNRKFFILLFIFRFFLWISFAFLFILSSLSLEVCLVFEFKFLTVNFWLNVLTNQKVNQSFESNYWISSCKELSKGTRRSVSFVWGNVKITPLC